MTLKTLLSCFVCSSFLSFRCCVEISSMLLSLCPIWGKPNREYLIHITCQRLFHSEGKNLYWDLLESWYYKQFQANHLLRLKSSLRCWNDAKLPRKQLLSQKAARIFSLRWRSPASQLWQPSKVLALVEVWKLPWLVIIGKECNTSR